MVDDLHMLVRELMADEVIRGVPLGAWDWTPDGVVFHKGCDHIRLHPRCFSLGRLRFPIKSVPCDLTVFNGVMASWENFPEEVPGLLAINNNKGVRTLVGSPRIVGSLRATNCSIPNLDGMPDIAEDLPSTSIARSSEICLDQNPIESYAGIENISPNVNMIKLPIDLNVGLLRLLKAPMNSIVVLSSSSFSDDAQLNLLAKIQKWRDIYWTGSRNRAIMGLQKDLVDSGLPGMAKMD